MKKQMVGDVPGNVLGMLADLLHKIQHGIITAQELAHFLKRENPFEDSKYRALVREWEEFYQKVFNISVDLSGVRIPECPGPGWRLIIVARLISPWEIFQQMKFFFKVRYDTGPFEIENERDSRNGAYAIWVRDTQEADEIHKNKSANQVRAEKLSTETLTESLIHEFKYFQETGKYLSDITLCSGTLCLDSRLENRYTPIMLWDSFRDELEIKLETIDFICDGLYFREVVS